MKNAFLIVYLVTSVVLFNSDCSKNKDDYNVSDYEIESDITECSTQCSFKDSCNFFLNDKCGTNIYITQFPVCIDGIMYDCKIPEQSDCCPGLLYDIFNIGPCTGEFHYCLEGDTDLEYYETDRL